METSSHAIFFSTLFFKEKRKWVWLIRIRVLRVQLMFVRFKLSGNQTGFNRWKNQEIDLDDLPGHGIDRSRRCDRLTEVGSSLCDWLTWAWSISICSAYFRCSGYIYQDRPVQIERLLTGSIDPFGKKKLWTLGFFFGILNISLNYFS